MSLKRCVGSFPSAAVVVEAEVDDVLHVVRVLERLDGRVEVGLVGEVDALQDGTLRVQQVAVVVAAAAVVLCQHAVSTGTGALGVASIETQLLTAAIVVFADIGAWGECDTFMRRVVKQIMSLVKCSISALPVFFIKLGGKTFFIIIARVELFSLHMRTCMGRSLFLKTDFYGHFFS